MGKFFTYLEIMPIDNYTYFAEKRANYKSFLLIGNAESRSY